MNYIEYKERRKHGNFNFPIAFYHVNANVPRYHMICHWHTEYEIIRVLSGTFHMNMNGEKIQLEAGDVAFITDGTLHSGTPADCVYECVVFDMRVLWKDNHVCNRLIQDIMNHKLNIHHKFSGTPSSLLKVIEQLFHAMSERAPGYEFATMGSLYQFMGIVQQECLYDQEAAEKPASYHLSSLKKVLTFVSEHFQEPISLDTLSKIAGMNSKYFCRYFRSMTERTPIDYLNYYRIECACEQLTTQDISVKEAAIACGFNDESYFIKTFQKYKNQTPRQYAKMRF